MSKKIKVRQNKNYVFIFLRLLIGNIKKRGFLYTFIICYYELIYFFATNFRDFASSNISHYYSNPRTYISINGKKYIKSYDTPHVPTPYYFLDIIKKQIKKMKVEDFTFIDFGCGSGRVTNF
jgi:hypothetical protein